MTDPAAPEAGQPGGRDRLNCIDLRWPQLTNLPTWLWVSPAEWAPESKTATVPGGA